MAMQLLTDMNRVLVTGGAGFIGGAVVRRLLLSSKVKVFNLDKIGYASNLKSIDQIIGASKRDLSQRYELVKADLTNYEVTEEAINYAKPDLIIHLAAESHVDRSIESPHEFIQSNINGTYNLLYASLKYWNKLTNKSKDRFRFIHVSTDEVFGTLGPKGKFDEATPYNPRSPYSASKAASDHLCKTWFHTYSFPSIITNCSNNFGPWQFPEKLIPTVIFKGLSNKSIPLYGDGKNIRDWLFVEDHVNALLQVSSKGKIGSTYCIGGDNEMSNRQVVEKICDIIDSLVPSQNSRRELIKLVNDRPGHDRRYAIDASKIKTQLGWCPENSFNEDLLSTVKWYLKNIDWCSYLIEKSGYKGDRIGLLK